MQRATALDAKIKEEIKALHTEKREHLSYLLQQEEKRLEALTAQLKSVNDTDEIKKTDIEEKLIDLEALVGKEVNLIIN